MNDDETTAFITSDIFHCARCGQDHDRIAFQKFTVPIVDADGTVWDLWGMCPVLNEPILMSKLTKPR